MNRDIASYSELGVKVDSWKFRGVCHGVSLHKHVVNTVNDTVACVRAHISALKHIQENKSSPVGGVDLHSICNALHSATG